MAHKAITKFVILHTDLQGMLNLHVLPVVPEAVTIVTGRSIIQSTVLSIGELSQIGPQRLKRISFSSFFPEFVDTFTSVRDQNLLLEPRAWVDLFNEFQKQPITFVITEPQFFGLYIVNSFTHSLIGGEGGDIRYTVNMVEYKDVRVRSANVGYSNQPIKIFTVQPLTYVPGMNFYTIQEGDTITSISRITGVSPAFILSTNSIKNRDKLEVGQRLRLRLNVVFQPSREEGQ